MSASDDAPQAAPGPKEGDVLGGKYRVTARIGEGGMGAVFAAEDQALKRSVAIKVLLRSRADDGEANARFLREARAAAAITSEHVVRVLEVDAQDGTPYIVMEHLRGADLAEHLRARGPLPVSEAVDFVLQACEALAEAHALGIVHRDLKPQNLFLSRRADASPLVKVLDFGISKAPTAEAPGALTRTSSMLGSPMYMSPEQVRAQRDVDRRADIWALGVVLFELLTGQPVFDAPTVSAVYAMIAADPPRKLTSLKPELPVLLEQVILRCLEKDPERRFADVGAFARALAPFADDGSRASIERIERVVEATATTNRPEQLARSATTEPPAAAKETARTSQAWAEASAKELPTEPASARPRRRSSYSVGLVAALVLGAGMYALGREDRPKAQPVAMSAVPAPTTTVTPTAAPAPSPEPTSLASASASPSARARRPRPAPLDKGHTLTAKELDDSEHRAQSAQMMLTHGDPRGAYNFTHAFVATDQSGPREDGILATACAQMQNGDDKMERELGHVCLLEIEAHRLRTK